MFLFSVILTALRNISGFSGDIVGVSFTGPAQGPEANYRERFGPRVKFSAQQAQMTLPKNALAQPISIVCLRPLRGARKTHADNVTAEAGDIAKRSQDH